MAPGLVASPFEQPPAKTAREYATELSAGRNKPPDPLEMMLGVAGGSPATFIGPAAKTWNRQAMQDFESMLAQGKTAEEARVATGVNLNAAQQPQQEISDVGSYMTQKVTPRPPTTVISSTSRTAKPPELRRPGQVQRSDFSPPIRRCRRAGSGDDTDIAENPKVIATWTNSAQISA
jgi:hypothetical protein